jgi:hypothetical protein
MAESLSGPQGPVAASGARPQPVVSRRALLRGLGAGAAALAAAPALVSGAPAGAAAAATAGLPRAATVAGLHGATLLLAAFPSGTTWAQAIATWEGYTGTTIKAAKVYYRPGVFPTSIGAQVKTYLNEGIKALLAFKPAFNPPSQADLAALENSLKMFRAAGLTATVTLWQEAQNVMSAAQFRRVVHYYGPMIRNYYPVAYDAFGSAGPSSWTNYYPGDSFVDVVAIDYYAPSYLKGITLDVLGRIADSASPAKPFGIWEMGNSAGGVIPTQSQMQSYFGYLQSFMAGRLQAGKANAELVWFNGNGVDTIRSSSDYRVPLWDSLVSATS